MQDQEKQEVQALLQRGASKRTSEAERQEERGEPIRRLSIEMDGVFARLRRDSVPMEEAEHERAGSLVGSSPVGEQGVPMEEAEHERAGDVYREVKVGAVFVGEPGRERSALVPGVMVDTPGPIQSTARRTSAEEFAPQLYALAHRVGLPRATEVVVLADGATWIWGIADEQFPGAVQIVDEYHARQHVWNVARAAFAADPSHRDAWAQTVLTHLSEGRIEAVIAAIENVPLVAPEPGKARSVPDIEADYFRRNAERMRYPVFRAQGMHVGSGIAEAACKTVVSTRAKRSGMHWTRKATRCHPGFARRCSQRLVRSALARPSGGCLIAYNFFLHPTKFPGPLYLACHTFLHVACATQYGGNPSCIVGATHRDARFCRVIWIKPSSECTT